MTIQKKSDTKFIRIVEVEDSLDGLNRLSEMLEQEKFRLEQQLAELDERIAQNNLEVSEVKKLGIKTEAEMVEVAPIEEPIE